MTVRLFLTGKFLPNYVEAVFASRRLPPKAAVSACSRHSFVEGIRNGGLDFVKAAVSVFRAWQLPAERRLFSFAVARQIISLYNDCSELSVVKSHSAHNLSSRCRSADSHKTYNYIDNAEHTKHPLVYPFQNDLSVSTG